MDAPVAGTKVNWLTGSTENRQEDSGILGTAEAYTHTLVAILDARRASDMPVGEVQLPNIQMRDAFRHTSNVSKAANGMIYGFGSQSSEYALDAMRGLIHTPS